MSFRTRALTFRIRALVLGASFLLLLTGSTAPDTARAVSYAFSQSLFTIGSGADAVDVSLGNIDATQLSFDLTLSGMTRSTLGTSDPYDFRSLYGLAFNQVGLVPQLVDVQLLSSTLPSPGINGSSSAFASPSAPQIQVALSDLDGMSFTASFRIFVDQLEGSYLFFPFEGTNFGCSEQGFCLDGDAVEFAGRSFAIDAIPEPSAALLFMLGATLVARRTSGALR